MLAAPFLSKQGVSVDYLIPPPTPSVIEKETRLISTLYLQEFKPVSPMRGKGLRQRECMRQRIVGSFAGNMHVTSLCMTA